MLVYISGNLTILVDDDPQNNRQLIADEGNALRLRVENNRFNDLYQLHGDTDNEAIILMLKILSHDKVYGHLEPIVKRRNSLFNVARTVCVLSDRAKHVGEPERFREKYSFEERSIWRDIEFLQKTLIPRDQRPLISSFQIDDDIVKKILDEDGPKIASLMGMELDQSISEVEKQQKRDKYKNQASLLENTYVIASYYREREALQKILDHTEPNFIRSLDLSTRNGRINLLKALEIIGEYTSKKNLSQMTRDACIEMDWNLLVSMRNKLAHHEWLLANNRGISTLVDMLLDDGIKDEIIFIHTQLKVILNDLVSIEIYGTHYTESFLPKLKERFIPKTPTLTLDSVKKIISFLDCYKSSGFISEHAYKDLHRSVLSRPNIMRTDLLDDIQQAIGKEKFSKEYRESLKAQDLKMQEELQTEFSQLKGELTKQPNTDKIKQKMFGLLNTLQSNKLIQQTQFDSFHQAIKQAKIVDLLNIAQDINTTCHLYKESDLALLLERQKIVDTSNPKRRDDLIKTLYNTIVKDLTDEDQAENKKAIDEVLKNKRSAPDTSKKISDIKLASIDKLLNSRHLVLDPPKLALSETFHSTVRGVDAVPKMSDGMRARIPKFMTTLDELKLLNPDEHNTLLALLSNEEFSGFVAMLESQILPRMISNNKNEDLVKLEQMRKDFGEIADTISKDKESFERQQQSLTNQRENPNLTWLPQIRQQLAQALPNEPDVAPNRNCPNYQRNVQIQLIFALDYLESMFRSLNSHSFNAQRHSFPEYSELIGIDPNDHPLVSALPQGSLYWNQVRIISTLYPKFAKLIAVPYGGPSLGITLDDSVSRRPRDLAGDEAKSQVLSYIQSNPIQIISKTQDYAVFLTLSKKLASNPRLLQEGEYVVSSIFTYLDQLGNNHNLPQFPDLLRRELKAQRNVSKHGNLYVDILNTPMDEFLVRYASIFIKDIKPQLRAMPQIQVP